MGYFRSLSRERLLYSNSYALSQNYGAVHTVATLSYNIPVSKVETLLWAYLISGMGRPVPEIRYAPYFLCVELASLVVAVSETAPAWPVKISELLSLLLSKGRAPSQNCADININYYQKRQYTTSSSALALCREALTPAWPTCVGGGWKTRRWFKTLPKQISGGSFEKLTATQCPEPRKKGLWRAGGSNPGCNQSC